MDYLLKTKLFSLLSNTSTVTNEEMQCAYEDFALKLLNKLQMETNITTLYYSLGYVRLELAEISEKLFDGKGEKCH